MVKTLLLAAVLTLPLAVRAQALSYVFDTGHTEVVFEYRLGFLSGEGGFAGVSGQVNYDAATPEHTLVEAIVDTRTLSADLGIAAELRGGAFFDVKAHPEMRFVSGSVTADSPERLRISGHLTIKGVSRPVRLHVRLVRRGGTLSFDASMRIRRSDFNMVGYSALVGDSVDIRIVGPLRPAP